MVPKSFQSPMQSDHVACGLVAAGVAPECPWPEVPVCLCLPHLHGQQLSEGHTSASVMPARAPGVPQTGRHGGTAREDPALTDRSGQPSSESLSPPARCPVGVLPQQGALCWLVLFVCCSSFSEKPEIKLDPKTF